MSATTPTPDTIDIAPHGDCNIVTEHGREWAVCNPCGAQWALNESDLEVVTEGDGSCEAEPCLCGASVVDGWTGQGVHHGEHRCARVVR